jgi:hypothetical protein
VTEKTATIHLGSELLRIEIRVAIKRTDKACLPALTIDLEKTPLPYTQLSITMGSWERPTPRGRWQEGCWGQARSLILESLDTLDSVNTKRAMTDIDRVAVRALCALWERWHLNDLKGGTRAQQEALASDEFKRMPPVGDHYDTSSAFLTKKGLNPDRGYRYGQAWLVELVPDSVLAEVDALSTSLGAVFTESESDEP